MTAKILTLTVLLALTMVALSKPVYDHKTSYVTQLTDFNFKDQVTKIRQNTNYVSLVQFYKYDGNTSSTQTGNPSPSPNSSTNGCTNTTASSESEQSIATPTPNYARRRTSKCTPPSRYIPPHQCPRLPSPYSTLYVVIIYSLKSAESSCQVPALQRDRDNKC